METDHKSPFCFTLNMVPVAGRPLEMPRVIPIWAGLVSMGMSVIFAAIWWSTFNKLHLDGSGGMPNLMSSLFLLFWLIGWSMGVLFLGLLTIFLFLFRESAYLSRGQMIGMLSVGPAAIRYEYELARMRNLRVEQDRGGRTAKIHFDYDGIGCSIGNMMKPDVAARNLQSLQDAVGGAAFSTKPEFAPPPSPAAPPRGVSYSPPAQRRMPLVSMLALVAANMLPLVGVVSGDWTLADVMVLFWAESAIIAFYTLLKIAMVAKWWAPFPGLFFTSHFGGFMAIHFLFIYELFVRGINATGSEPGAMEVITSLFTDLHPALLALFASHGISFALNFIGRREYEGARLADLMREPYGRVILMHFTIILGGGLVMLLQNPVPALVLLIVLKVAADLRAHFAERNLKKRDRGNVKVSEKPKAPESNYFRAD
jgi:hypothetical protein